MTDPYETLGLTPAEADDATIRQSYLKLTRQFPPEHAPVQAAAVRAAYDAIKDKASRAEHRLFEAGAEATVDTVLEMLTCQKPRPRWSLDTLIGPPSARVRPPT